MSIQENNTDRRFNFTMRIMRLHCQHSPLQESTNDSTPLFSLSLVTPYSFRTLDFSSRLEQSASTWRSFHHLHKTHQISHADCCVSHDISTLSPTSGTKQLLDLSSRHPSADCCVSRSPTSQQSASTWRSFHHLPKTHQHCRADCCEATTSQL